MKKKTLSVVAFLGAAVIAGGVVLSCSKQEKPAPPPVARKEQPAQPAVPAPPPVNAPLSLDFSNAPLADVVPFVTQHTGTGFLLNVTEGKTISWTEYNIPRERLFDSFLAALAAFDLEAKPVEGRNVYTIGPTPEPDVTVKLNSARGTKGTFFFLGSSMYRQDEFPYPTHQDASGFWYATVPKSVSDSMTSPDDSPKDAKL